MQFSILLPILWGPHKRLNTRQMVKIKAEEAEMYRFLVFMGHTSKTLVPTFIPQQQPHQDYFLWLSSTPHDHLLHFMCNSSRIPLSRSSSFLTLKTTAEKVFMFFILTVPTKTSASIHRHGHDGAFPPLYCPFLLNLVISMFCVDTNSPLLL